MASNPGRDAILLVFSCFGSLSSIVWAALAGNYAELQWHFEQAVVELEKGYFPEHVPLASVKRREKVLARRPWKSGRFLIALVTWGFVGLYPTLELVVCWKGFIHLIRCLLHYC